MIRPKDQYDAALACRWDEFIDWQARAQAEQSFFQNRLKEAGAQSVLDAACGTGFHTVALAKAGFSVVASDLSPAMVRQTTRACRAHRVDVEVRQADWRHLSDAMHKRFDSVVVLGNSFTHLLAYRDRLLALQQFRKTLRPGGLLVIDSRNYDKMLETARPFTGDFYYCGRTVTCTPIIVTPDRIRFRYDFQDGFQRELDAYPTRQAELSSLLTDTGFEDVAVFGDFRRPFERLDPDYVIYCAHRA